MKFYFSIVKVVQHQTKLWEINFLSPCHQLCRHKKYYSELYMQKKFNQQMLSIKIVIILRI